MTVLAAICVLATAACVGYYLGRRANTRPPTWRKRTSRVALGRRAMSLVVLVTARRIRRRLGSQRILSDAVDMCRRVRLMRIG